MAVLSVALLAFMLPLSSTYTLIPTSGWTEDWQYTSTPPEAIATESWWYNPGDGYTVDLGYTGSSPQDGTVWGWFNYDTDDPAPTQSRDFRCPSYSSVVLSFNVYFCISGTASSQTTFWYRRSGLVGTIAVEYNKAGTSSAPGYGGWSSRGTGICGSTVRKTTVYDAFTPLPGSGFTIGITKKMKNADSNTNKQVVAFNNFNIQCTQIPTPAPTPVPTSPTGIPTPVPTRKPTTNPTAKATSDPTKKPTKPPTSPKPTASPTTLKPTPSPTKDPTPSPSDGPTLKPTDSPTKKPTAKPTDTPSHAPTAAVGLGQQFSNAFGMTQSDCVSEDFGTWIGCNKVVFVLLVICCVVSCCYWFCGVLWYKRRQGNRYKKMPSSLAQQDANRVEMGGQHVTSDKWKSAWEREQEEQM